MLEYLYQALREKNGLSVRFSTSAYVGKSRLESARRKACDPALDHLRILISPEDTQEVFIVNMEKPDGSTSGE